MTLTGATALHAALLEDTERLAAECRAVALGAGGSLWIEAVRVRTRALAQSQTELLAPLQAAFLAGLDEPELVARLLAELDAVRRKLPPAAQAELDIPNDEAALSLLAQDAWQIVAEALLAVTPE